MRTAADYRRQFCAPDVMLTVLFWIRSRFGGVESYLKWIGLSPTAIEVLRGRLRG